MSYFPPCRQHVFLSHSREDHDDLVRPAYDKLVKGHVEPWLDRHHYPYGADSRTALQSALLECRHVVFFVTEAMVANPRGWCVLELAYAELLQRNLTLPAGPLQNVILPLYFVPQDDALLPRTVWQVARDRGTFHDPTGGLDRVSWAVEQIASFLKREEERTRQHSARIRRDKPFRESLTFPVGLRDRVSVFRPKPLP